MSRTKANSELSDRDRFARLKAGGNGDGPLEVTQLVTSFMGAFAHPFEVLLKLRDPSEHIRKDLRIPGDILLNDVRCVAAKPSLDESRGFVGNAVVHGNIEFVGGKVQGPVGQLRDDIVSIRIWNCRRAGTCRDGRREQDLGWEKTYSVDALRTLLLAFIGVMTRVDPVLFERTTDCLPV